MLCHLPCDNFEDLCPEMVAKIEEEFKKNGGINFRKDSEFGLLMECDLECADEETARLLDIFPCCVENKEISEDQFSPYMTKLKSDKKIETSGQRLIMDLNPKRHMYVNAYALRCYLRLGISLVKLPSVIAFHQAPILKSHIERLSTLRNAFEAQGLVSNAQACKKLANRFVCCGFYYYYYH